MGPDDDTYAVLRELSQTVLGPGAYGDDASSRTLSSVEVMRFLVHVERRFRIAIPDAELRPENFVSLETVAKMVLRNKS